MEGLIKIRQNKRLFFIIILIMNFSMLLSPFVTSKMVYNQDDLGEIAFGFPFPFVVQDLSAYDPPFPYKMSLSSPLENPTHLNLLSLLASIITVNIVIWFFYYFILKRQRMN